MDMGFAKSLFGGVTQLQRSCLSLRRLNLLIEREIVHNVPVGRFQMSSLLVEKTFTTAFSEHTDSAGTLSLNNASNSRVSQNHLLGPCRPSDFRSWMCDHRSWSRKRNIWIIWGRACTDTELLHPPHKLRWLKLTILPRLLTGCHTTYFQVETTSVSVVNNGGWAIYHRGWIAVL